MILETIDKPVQLMKKSLESLNYRDKETYARFLAQSAYYVAHSTRLLAFAAGHLPKSEERYFRRFVKHIGEEVSHEILAEKDMNDLGYQLSDFPELPETRMLWETQYYKIQFVDPMSFMGYILVLEQIGCEAMPAIQEVVQDAYNGEGLRFVRLHAEEDPDHVTKAVQFTETLSQDRQLLVVENAIQTALSYSSLIKRCGQTYSQSHLGTALSL